MHDCVESLLTLLTSKEGLEPITFDKSSSYFNLHYYLQKRWEKVKR
jgi:hypothetical protein